MVIMTTVRIVCSGCQGKKTKGGKVCPTCMGTGAELTRQQRDIARQREKRLALNKEIDKRISDLYERIAPMCLHPLVKPYNWEWDSGYGRQSTVTGERCVFCGAESPHSNGTFYRTEHAKYWI